MLERFPVQGEAHRWIARVAVGLRDTFSEARCLAVLSRLCEHVRHRRIPEREIRDAVRFAYGGGAAAGGGRRGRPPAAPLRKAQRTTFDWPEADGELMARVVATVEPLFDPARDTGVPADEALQGLFAPGEWVCTGPSQTAALVRPLEKAAADAAWMQFIVPNPMKGPEAVNKAGKASGRCQANVLLRRHLVAEFDQPGLGHDAQARLITALAREAPLRMVVDSAGKSLHAWFLAEGLGLAASARFFGYACGLGADPTRWDPCGWMRMPGGLRRRDEGPPARQRVVYWGAG